MAERTAWTGGGTRIARPPGSRAEDALPDRYKQLADGRLDPATLDDEEVMTGRLRTASGALGTRPRVLPVALVDEQVKRALHAGTDRFRRYYERAVAAVCEIATDPNQSASDRLKAAGMVIDRVAGKDPVVVRIGSEDPIEALFKGILSDPDGLQEPVAPPREPGRVDL